MSYRRNRRRKDIRHARLFGRCTRCEKPFSSKNAIYWVGYNNPTRVHWKCIRIAECFGPSVEFVAYPSDNYVPNPFIKR